MNSTTFDFDPALYRLSAIKKAAYKFGDCFLLHLSTLENGHIRVTLAAKEQANGPQFQVSDFPNEVLDQELREIVAEETQPIRDILLAQAFSAVSLTDAEADEADYHADPKSILATGLSDLS